MTEKYRDYALVYYFKQLILFEITILKHAIYEYQMKVKVMKKMLGFVCVVGFTVGK